MERQSKPFEKGRKGVETFMCDFGVVEMLSSISIRLFLYRQHDRHIAVLISNRVQCLEYDS